MRDISFFSNDNYLYLPSKKNPKVILAISDTVASQNSYQLYNPFSYKAKLFKKMVCFLLPKFKKIAKTIVKTRFHHKSNFVFYLENTLDKSLTVSLYYATDNDKVVLQLQTDHAIYGYLKFPLNKRGVKKINSEKQAIELLSGKNIAAPMIHSGEYDNNPYFIVPHFEGEIEKPLISDVEKLVLKFRKNDKLKLVDHDRVKQLQADLESLGLQSSYVLSILNTIVSNSNEYYYTAFEHGDLTPWNIVKTKEGLIPFDFEYFIENGMEYLDLIKYHFQIGRLLEKKNYKELSVYLFNKIDIVEIKSLVSLFLISEIVRLKKENESYSFQENMLKYLSEKTI